MMIASKMSLAVFTALLSLFATTHAWTVTIYYIQALTIYTEDVYTFADGEVTTYSAETYSTLMQATPTVSSFSAVSTETSVDSYDEVTYINILLPSDVAEEFDPYYDDPDYIDRYDNSYMVALTYSADEDYCTRDGENWVWTTGVSISVPYGAKPTAISSSLSMTQFSAFDPTSTFTHLYINPTEVPASSLSSLSSYYSEYWMDYSCTVPASKASGIVTGAVASSTPSSNADSDDTNSSPSSSIVSGGRESQCEDGDWWWYSDWGFGGEVECRTGPDVRWGLRPWEFVIIIIFGWLGLFLIIGLIESYINFSRLATGRKARRGLPLSFCMLFPFLSCFFLCCSKRGFNAKPKEDQELMAAAWKQTSFGKKIGRWLKWGFRYKYPAFLGPAPFRRSKWEDKDVALEAQRRLSVSGVGPQMSGATGGVPFVAAGGLAAEKGATGVQVQPVHPAEGFYAPPVPPQAAYASPGVENRDFALQQQQVQQAAPQLPPQQPQRPLSAVDEEQRPVSAQRNIDDTIVSPVSPAPPPPVPAVSAGAPAPAQTEVPTSLQAGVPAGAPPVPSAPAPVADRYA